MRPDMHEVVIERPRYGSGDRSIKDRWRWDGDEEACPSRLSFRRRATHGTKSLSDLLGPLRRFLHSSVGRPWDKVYSDLRAGLSPRSLLHMHILQHVKYMVDLEPNRWSWLYVCPKTGLLRRNEALRRVRDPDRGDLVTPRRMLLRRVGRPWAVVLAQFKAADEELPAMVWRDVKMVQGKPHPLFSADGERPARLGLRLNRGQLYVHDGLLQLAR